LEAPKYYMLFGGGVSKKNDQAKIAAMGLGLGWVAVRHV